MAFWRHLLHIGAGKPIIISGDPADNLNNLMFDIVIIILLISLVLAASFLLQAFILGFAARQMGVPGVKYLTSLKITGLLTLACLLAILFLSLFFAGMFGGEWLTDTKFYEHLGVFLFFAVALFAFHFLMKRYYATGIKKNIALGAAVYALNVLASIALMPATTLIRGNIFEPFVVHGNSMEPNYDEGDYLFAKKWEHDYARGDVVVFKYPQDTTKIFIKRIIGLPGEVVEISNNQVYITDTSGRKAALGEVYIPEGTVTADITSYRLGKSQYYVMGDNRPYSTDSRQWGGLPDNLIVGKIIDF